MSGYRDHPRLNPKIVHFAQLFKPWHFMSDQEYKDEYWMYLSNMPWADYRPFDRTVTNRLKKLVPIEWRNYLRPIRSGVFARYAPPPWQLDAATRCSAGSRPQILFDDQARVAVVCR
jgi:hypothetical protein